jgi:hypothetical protein
MTHNVWSHPYWKTEGTEFIQKQGMKNPTGSTMGCSVFLCQDTLHLLPHIKNYNI